MSDRFLLRQDLSSHWYVIPAERKAAWDAWCDLDEDDEAAWDAPEWATEIDSPHHLVFTGAWERA